MYGLLGEKLGHSFSPQIHALLGDYEYRLFEKQKNELDDFFKNRNWDGINVTIPYKKAVIPYLDRLSPSAEKIGSVNTIVAEKDGTLTGYNTDYDGFSYLIDVFRNIGRKQKMSRFGFRRRIFNGDSGAEG